jgi:hypothetical protein
MFAWIFFNLIIPFGLPFAPLLILRIIRNTIANDNTVVANNIRLTLAIKDGQLCITCIAVVALTFYELWAVRTVWSAAILVGLGLVALACAILIAYATLYPAPVDGLANQSKWRKRYEIAFTSLVLSLFVIVFAVVGRIIVVNHEEAQKEALKKTEVKTVPVVPSQITGK